MLDLSKRIKNFRGEDITMSFPTKAMLDGLPLNSNNKPDLSKLPKETYRNLILNCLANYIIKDKRENFYINALAQLIIDENKKSLNLKNKFKNFLISVLNDSVLQKNDKEVISGIFPSWNIGPILRDLNADDDLVINSEDLEEGIPEVAEKKK